MNPGSDSAKTVTAFLGDNWAEQVLPLLEESVRLCIAAAYMDLQGVRLLKSILKETNPSQSRSFNFLLDKNFHDNEYARQVIVNELLEIPQAEVRIHEGQDEFLHSKVFIFHAGNLVYVLVGSMNPTGAGIKRNIEAGIQTTDPEVRVKAQAFFNKYWSGARRASYIAGADYEKQLYRPGERVLHLTSGRVGFITSEDRPRREHQNWVYPVLFDSEKPAEWILETELTPFEVTVIRARSPVELTVQDISAFRKRYLRAKLLEASDKNLFSYQSSRTDRLPYQFKPLFRILSAKRPRLLIADEVGLGKTIEAGIVIQEFQARLPLLRRVLVVCPNNLQEKWDNELSARFDSYYDKLTKSAFLGWIAEYTQKAGDLPLAGISSFDLIRSRQVAEAIRRAEISIDILIVDEAHHLRNQGTQIHEIMRDLCRRANVILFLTATPVNLGNQDLFHLMQLLVPGEFAEMNFAAWQDFLNPNRYFMECVRLAESGSGRGIHEILEREVARNPTYGPRYNGVPEFARSMERARRWQSLSTIEIALLQQDLLRLNPLQHFINRTRKVEVQEIVDRVVSADSFEYSKEERQRYEAILDKCRTDFEKSGKRRAPFLFVMPERQAASCLPVAWRKYGEGTPVEVSSDETSIVFDDAESDGDREVARRSRTSVTDAMLTWPDTKFDRFARYVREVHKVDGESEKFVVFSFFLDTVDYLVRRLNKTFGERFAVALSGRIPDLASREKVRKLWEDDDGPKVLVCSEIGSEGLDLQRKCRRLVNYDLPWNPMRLEQRIGRIDRYGQKSKKVFVWNPIAKDTIDNIIFGRLQSRVRIAENAIGPVADVLGRWETEFTRILLERDLSVAELDRRVRQEEARLLEAQAEETRLARNELSLSGLDEYFAKEISGVELNRRYFAPREVQTVIEIFNQEAPGESSLEPDGTGLFRWKLSDDAAQILSQLVERDVRIIEQRKRVLYLDLLNSRKDFPVTFDQDVAKEDIRTTFLTIHNPLVSAILRLWEVRDTERIQGNITIRTNVVPPARYLWVAYYVRYSSPAVRASVFLIHQVLRLSDELLLDDNQASHLADEIVLGKQDVRLGLPDRQEDLRSPVDTVNRHIEQVLRELKVEREARTAAVQGARIEGLDATYSQQLEGLNTDLRRAIDPIEVRRLSDRIELLRGQWQEERRTALTMSKFSTQAFPILTMTVVVEAEHG